MLIIFTTQKQYWWDANTETIHQQLLHLVSIIQERWIIEEKWRSVESIRHFVAYAENSHGVGFIQWYMVVICVWCPLFVTSQYDVMFMFPNQQFGEVFWHNTQFLLHALPLIYTSQFDVKFKFPNQRFGDVFWHNMHIHLHALPLIYVSRNWRWTISAPGWDIYDTAVHNCKNMRLRVKTGEWNTHHCVRQFTTAEWGFANVLSNTSSRTQKVCGWTGWRIPLLARSNFAKYTNWECA